MVSTSPQYVVLSKARSLLVLELESGFVWLLGAYVDLLLSSATRATRFSVISDSIPQCKAYCSAGLCLPGKSMFARPKIIALSWPKIVCPVVDGKHLATCGM